MLLKCFLSDAQCGNNAIAILLLQKLKQSDSSDLSQQNSAKMKTASELVTDVGERIKHSP